MFSVIARLLQCVSICGIVLQCAAVYYNMLQCVAVRIYIGIYILAHKHICMHVVGDKD